MVVKSATKKKLMDRGMGEDAAHRLATDRRWDDVMKMTPREIGEVVGRVEDAAIIIWLKIGGLEVKFDRNNDKKIFLFPKFMGDNEKEPVFSYNFGTENVGFHGNEAFRGLGSLFGDNTIYDWFTPHTSNQHSAFEFANIPNDANDKQKEQLSSLLNIGVMKNILTRIENKVFFDGYSVSYFCISSSKLIKSFRIVKSIIFSSFAVTISIYLYSASLSFSSSIKQ